MIPITLNLKNKKVVHIPVRSNINIVREIKKKTSTDKDRWIIYIYIYIKLRKWSKS